MTNGILISLREIIFHFKIYTMRFVFIFLSLLFFASCNETSSSDNSEEPVEQIEKNDKGPTANKQMSREEAEAIRAKEMAASREGRENSDVEESTPAEPYNPQVIPLSYIEKYVGNYPSAINFLGNTALRSRMMELMGKEAFPEAERIWKQETPLEIQSGLIFTTAQEGPADNDPKLALMVDVGRDLLFVAVKNFETVGEQIFAERNADIPVRLKNWAEKK